MTRRRGVAAVVVLASLSPFAACGEDAPDTPSLTAVSSGATTPNAAPQRPVMPLKVESDGCSMIPTVSTGFAIDGGWVVTAAHATRGSTSVTVDGTPADVVAIDLRSDVTVLRPQSPIGAAEAVLADGEIGDSVTVAVRRDGEPVTLRGEVHRTPTINFEEPLDRTYYKRQGLILTGVTITHGDSGTAVADAAGAVVGMMFAMSHTKGFGYAVDADEIAALIPDRADAAAVDSLHC